MKKKLLISLLTIIMCISLVGCGNNSDNENGKKENDNQQENENKNNESNENDINTEIKLYSDDKKIVYNFNDIYKIVYYYEGNTVTGLEYYYNYETAEAAKYALVTLNTIYKQGEDTGIKEIKQKGSYAVIVFDSSEYGDLTVDEIKTTYSYLKEVYENN